MCLLAVLHYIIHLYYITLPWYFATSTVYIHRYIYIYKREAIQTPKSENNIGAPKEERGSIGGGMNSQVYNSRDTLF